MKLTAQLRLLPTPEQADVLKRTLQTTNAACNSISDLAWATRTFGKHALQKLVYQDVRGIFGLAAQATIRALAKVGDAYKLDTQTKRTFRPLVSIAYAEQDPDRWCSRTPCDQEFWQIISLWVWNTRLRLGLVAQPQEMRWTMWASVLSPVELDRPALTDAAPEAVKEDLLVDMSLAPSAPASPLHASAGTLVPIYGPLVLSQAWAKARRRFSAQAFSVGEGDTLRCPAGAVLRPRERRKMPSGDLRVLYAPGANDCRSCALAPACLGRGASGEQPRRVSGVRRVVGWQVLPKAAGEQPGVVPSLAEPQQQNAQPERVRQWVMWAGDGFGARWSRSYAANT